MAKNPSKPLGAWLRKGGNSQAGRSSIFPGAMLLTCLLMCLRCIAYGGDGGGIEKVYVSRLTGSVGTVNSMPLEQGQVIDLTYAAEYAVSRRIKNIITLSLIEESPKFITADFTVSVRVKIEYGPSPSSVSEREQVLTVNYSKTEGVKYNAKQYFHFEDADYVKVTVLDPPVVEGVNFADILLLENEMRVTRYFNLKAGVLPTFGAEAATADALNISWEWPVDAGNNYTQLEWSWLEDEMVGNYEVNSTLDYNLLFRRSATRIDLAASQLGYSIPLLYDGEGTLYYRIRAVNIKSGNRTDGPWSVVQSYDDFDGHEKGLNWQSTTSFAEEGKRKTVIQYFDGSLRSRQTVTRDNVTNTIVTAETLYDGQGRPAIQILPVPGISSIIKYQAGLNLFNGQGVTDNPAGSFDLEPLSTPGSLTAPLNVSTGASNYYSSSNSDKSGINRHIPDAEGYPYAVTRYTPDNTGRIMAQSGVGAGLKMGTGHETKYYYGNASQEELDGLFGTEAGNYTHYFKNMVKDANGQMSVSYVDMHGRTVATALAGDPNALESMVSLDLNSNDYKNQAGSSITRNLLDKNSNFVKGNVIESVNSLLVPATTGYSFTYSLDAAALQMAACSTGVTLCYDCQYDLEISITDESGDVAPIVKRFTNVSLSGADDDCSTSGLMFRDVNLPELPASNSWTFTQVLLPGSYSIRKTLAVNDTSLEKYKAEYLLKANCKSEQELIDSVYSVLLAETDCNNTDPGAVTCASCMATLGDSASYRAAYIASLTPEQVTAEVETAIVAAYNSDKQNCERICNTLSQAVASKRQMMLADMIPFSGQYARAFDPNFPPAGEEGYLSDMYYKYDIFSVIGSGLRPFYKNPWTKTEQLGYYYTPLNVIDPFIHPGGTYDKLNSTSVEEFGQWFNNSWAESLLPHHPEYKKLRYSETVLAESYNWIKTFSEVMTYSEAEALNYIVNSGTTTGAPYTDPFFAVVSQSDKGGMEAKVKDNYNNGISMWQIAYGDVKCKGIVNDGLRQGCYSGLTPKFPPFNDLTVAEKDQVWKVFRNLYMAERENYVNQHIESQFPLADGAQLIREKYILHFPVTNRQMADQYGFDWYPQTPGGSPNADLSEGAVTQTYTSRCESYINTWKQALLQCPSLAAHASRDIIISTITSQMAEVCRKGSDAANPFGSSNVNPNSPSDGSPRSFEEVINDVFEEYDIDITNLCNPYVIEFPKPYGQNPKFFNASVSVIETCTCERFTVLKQQATTAGYNASSLVSLNQYFLLQYGETMTAALYEGLQHCSELGQVYRCQTKDSLRWIPRGSTYACDTLQQFTSMKETSTPESLVPPQPQCSALQNVITAFYNANASWIDTTQGCVASFVAFYNTYNQTNYTELEVMRFYRACELDDMICNGYEQVNCPVQVCGNEQSVYPLSQPQPLPEFLKCGSVSTSRCVTCEQMSTLTTEFKAIFNAPYNTAPIMGDVDLTSAQVDHNILYARFLNYRTGLQMSWLEYSQAAAAVGCDVLTGGSGGGTAPANLVVSTREVGRPLYKASVMIEFMPGFESETGAEFVAELGTGGSGSSGAIACRTSKPLGDTTGYLVPESACTRVYQMAVAEALQIQKARMEYLGALFDSEYRRKCLDVEAIETFNVAYTTSEYHYTLYYYDMGGNLVKTVPPKGVKPDFSPGFQALVKTARIAETHLVPPHEFTTNYRYNSLNQVVAQHTPDGGTSMFWYDKLGRLAVSRNAQQEIEGKYSYTLYDGLGRIKEVGQKPQSAAMTQTTSQNEIALNNWIMVDGGAREQITSTVYDIAEPIIEPLLVQQNLRNRVSYTATKNLSSDASHYTATYYTYDIHGNVDTLVQDYKGVSEMVAGASQYKRIAYDYDLISGKVNGVSYQPPVYNINTLTRVINPDAFYHRYNYDGENRLLSMETSRDSIIWERDAGYSYYKHGPLARTELGQLQVQGMDYAYTIQGWLKGINSTSLNPGMDIAGDGTAGSPTARDVVGFGLHYFDKEANNWQDYKPLDGASAFARPGSGSGFTSLYNGNIAAMSINNGGLLKGNASTTNALPLFNNYRYDQLNRLVSMQVYKGLDAATNVWTPVGLDDYKEAINYDPNGNIRTYNRNGAPQTGKPNEMDDLAYDYYPNTNRLRHVGDNPTYSGNYTEDIDNQGNPNNYTYDAIGNLKSDLSESITAINWTVYGKIASITKGGNTITYSYDASGNRITKTASGTTTIYVRDATGNVMSVYEKDAESPLKQTEVHLYGSSRVGLLTGKTVAPVNSTLSGTYGPATLDAFTRNEKMYEMSNHLGNVLATVSDAKNGVASQTNSSLIDHYTATILSAQDYYPFGMLMPGRKFSSSNYRYGFNGKENDNDVKGEGNSYNFDARIYDPRLGGRWLSVDPLAAMFPGQSPYLSMSGNPINRIDPTGKGDFYSKDGGHLSSDKKKDDLAYSTSQSIINSNTKNGVTDWDKVIQNKGTLKLSLKNSELTDFASSIADESSGDVIESYALGNAVVNGSGAENKTVQQFLVRYTSGYNSKISYSNLTDNAKYSMGAAINAITGGNDYSNGAVRWDGRDLLTQGTSHYRYAKAYYDDRKGIFIPSNMQSQVHSYIGNVLGYFAKTQTRNDALFMKAYENQITSNANQAGTLYTVTRAAGQTVFFVQNATTVSSQTTSYSSYDDDKLGTWYNTLLHLQFDKQNQPKK